MCHASNYNSLLPQIKSNISLLISVLVCRFLPHTFSLHSSLTFLTLVYVAKNKRKNSPYQSLFFLFTQCDPHAVPKQDLCPTQYGYPASVDSYTHNYDKKKLSVYQAFSDKNFIKIFV